MTRYMSCLGDVGHLSPLCQVFRVPKTARLTRFSSLAKRLMYSQAAEPLWLGESLEKIEHLSCRRTKDALRNGSTRSLHFG
jgi:hypothetical protein